MRKGTKFIKHSGILGMRWGHRKGSSGSDHRISINMSERFKNIDPKKIETGKKIASGVLKTAIGLAIISQVMKGHPIRINIDRKRVQNPSLKQLLKRLFPNFYQEDNVLRKKSKFIKHHGIPGMHWGRRKGDSSSSSSDHKTAQSLKDKRLQDMSNEELRTLTSRIQLEKQFREARKQDSSPGKKFVAEVMVGAGKQVATTYVAKFMGQGVEKMIKVLHLSP